MANLVISSPSLLCVDYSDIEKHDENSDDSDSNVNLKKFEKNVISDDYNKPSTSKQQSDISRCVNEKTKKHCTSYASKINNVDDICLSSDDSDVIVCDDLNSTTLMNDVSNLNRSDDNSVIITVMTVKGLHHILEENIGLKVLFKNHFMEPLSFLLLLHEYSLELRLTKLIEDCGGIVYNSITDADDFTIVLVKDDSIHWAYTGPVFKISYIPACIEAKKIINITPFFKSSFKKKYTNNFDFMTVVYFKKYTWDEVPTKYISPNVVDKSPLCESVTYNKKSNDNKSIIISDDESCENESNSSNVKTYKSINKHSRLLYSIKEDEDIIKYIVLKKGYHKLKGVAFWKTMEDKNICPHRTWQSMKEHFIKKIVFRLDNFTFLTNKQKELLQLVVLR
ncbi:uncharacterized protein LOC142325277 [Lycorma delicatula]|uniref:uncharacterized protein LOC142325277 n=1 Tax=Lycorma delicatula TaxID=130591 RepID=UPI003F5106FE